MKKVRDIIPPNPKETQNYETVSVANIENKKNRAIKKTKKYQGIFWIAGFVIFLLVGGLLALSFWSSLKLNITIKQETADLTQEATVSSAQETIDLNAKILPAVFFEKEAEKNEVFQSTGSSLENKKARGTITVYNEYNPPTAVSLKQGTRFLASEGEKIFKCLEKINLQPAKLEKGKIIPSAAKIEVEAYEGGESYNIDPAKFSVPGLSGTALYAYIKGESTTAMVGGSEQKIQKITAEDISQAKESLKTGLRKSIGDELKTAEGSGYEISDRLIFAENFESSCYGKPGETIDSFKCEAKAKIKWLAFKKDDLKEMATSLINVQNPGKTIQEQSLVFSFSPKNIAADKSLITGDITSQGKTYLNVDKNFFLSDISGKSEDQIRQIISNSYPQIINAEFKFWPFWINKAPKEINKIELFTNFSE